MTEDLVMSNKSSNFAAVFAVSTSECLKRTETRNAEFS